MSDDRLRLGLSALAGALCLAWTASAAESASAPPDKCYAACKAHCDQADDQCLLQAAPGSPNHTPNLTGSPPSTAIEACHKQGLVCVRACRPCPPDSNAMQSSIPKKR